MKNYVVLGVLFLTITICSFICDQSSNDESERFEDFPIIATHETTDKLI